LKAPSLPFAPRALREPLSTPKKATVASITPPHSGLCVSSTLLPALPLTSPCQD
jgi:hypothetical protein